MNSSIEMIDHPDLINFFEGKKGTKGFGSDREDNILISLAADTATSKPAVHHKVELQPCSIVREIKTAWRKEGHANKDRKKKKNETES